MVHFLQTKSNGKNPQKTYTIKSVDKERYFLRFQDTVTDRPTMKGRVSVVGRDVVNHSRKRRILTDVERVAVAAKHRMVVVDIYYTYTNGRGGCF